MNAPVTTAILLAAGRGKRLRPHTDRLPKPLLPWNKKPTLHWIFESLRSAGITRVVLVAHYLQEHIEDFAAAYSEELPNFTITTAHQDQLDGTATAVGAALAQEPAWFKNSFLVTATDYLTPATFYGEFLGFHRQHNQPVSISLRAIPDSESAARSSVAFEGDFVISQVVEKPPPGTAPSHYSANLVYVLPTELKSHILDVKRSARGEFELQSAVNAYLDTGHRGRGLLQSAPDEWTPKLLNT